MEITLINEELFKENSPIKEDTVISKFVPYIRIAQKLYIERILGTPLTNELKQQIQAASLPDATGEEISPANRALILKIAPALSFYAVYQGLPFHWASIVNKGLTKRNSENSDAVNADDLAQLRRWIKDDAEELGRTLSDYLHTCKDSYPLWNDTGNCSCGRAENRAADDLDAGIFIPNRD